MFLFIYSGRYLPVGRPTISSRCARRPAAVRRMYQRVPAPHDKDPSHAPAALPQGGGLHRHHAKCTYRHS